MSKKVFFLKIIQIFKRYLREAEQGRGASEWKVPKRPLGASGIKAVGRRTGEDLGSPLLFSGGIKWISDLHAHTNCRPSPALSFIEGARCLFCPGTCGLEVCV